MLIQLFDWIAAQMILLGMEVRQFKCSSNLQMEELLVHHLIVIILTTSFMIFKKIHNFNFIIIFGDMFGYQAYICCSSRHICLIVILISAMTNVHAII